MKHPLSLLILVIVVLQTAFATATVSTFDDLVLPAPTGGGAYPGGGHYWNGSDEAGSFTSREATFYNDYNIYFGSWSGWAYSNTTDTTTPSASNQYSAYTDGGGGGVDSPNFGVSYVALDWQGGTYGPIPTAIDFPDARKIEGAYFTNTTYAFLAIRDGDDGVGGFVRKFGDDPSTPEEETDYPDYFKLTITGKNGAQVTGSVEFFLADYTFEDDNQDYIVSEWTWVDLSGLGLVTSVEFSLESTDVDPDYGMNTPAYFAMDNLEATTPASVPSLPNTGLAIGLLLVMGLGLFQMRRMLG